MKDFIKNKLRENLTEKENKEESNKKNDSYETDYKEIQGKLIDSPLKAAQVMEKSGQGKASDATARSLFSKKLHRKKNDEGSEYKFSPEEINSIKKIINNPNSL